MKNNPNYNVVNYFKSPKNSNHRQFNAMRSFFLEGRDAAKVASEFGYKVSTVYSMARDLKKKLLASPDKDPYFRDVVLGRKEIDNDGSLNSIITALRKSYMSVPEIKSILEAAEISVSLSYIDSVLKKDGFARLPRRDREIKEETVIGATGIEIDALIAEKSKKLDMSDERFTSQLAGILCFLPFIKEYGFDKAIERSSYPGTSAIGKMSSILAVLALKLSNIKRYSMDDLWCMDRGMGLFAGLNVLPKASWYSSYSSRVTREMNIDFLKNLYEIFDKKGFLSDTANLDFSTIPYWGDDDTFENNWSGKRNKAMASMLTLLVQDPDSGIICYGDLTLRHSRQNDAILEFLDFYKENENRQTKLKYLIFDSKLTTYENLNKLNKWSIKFVTIRRRGAKLLQRINEIKPSEWKKVRVSRSNGKSREVKVFEERAIVKDYEGELRQIYITGNGKIKPAIIITNDFESKVETILRKYSRRWLVEKEISEHIEFFHLNRNSSGIVIKVDFDLTMTILAHNLYRVFSKELEGYSHCDANKIFDRFVYNAGEIEIKDKNIIVKLKKKRHLPILLECMNGMKKYKLEWLDNYKITVDASTTT